MSTAFPSRSPLRRTLLAAALATSLIHPAAGQTAAPTSASSTSTADTRPEETITLTVFEVRSEKDVGYQAANTTSGSRLNTALKDTAAAITPFTKEFLDDIGATSLTDLMMFSNNYEPDFNDGEGFNALAARRADTTNAPFRVRGQTGGVSIDLAETGVPIDLADVERVEVASGPNSILFGTGATGGIVALSTKRAQLNRSSYLLRGVLGSWDLHRAEIDFNQVIKKNLLAVRVFGLNSSREGWRHWDFEDSRRFTGAVTVRPFASTNVSASHGRGHLERHMTTLMSGADQITLWRSLGSQVSDGAANLAGAGTAAVATVNRYTLFENDGTVFNMRNELASRGALNAAAEYKRMLPHELMPIDYSPTGPGARYRSDFENTIVRLDQKIADVVVEAVWQRNVADNFANSYQITNNTVDLLGDPNVTLPLLAGGTTPNARQRQLYMETNWRPETARIANEVARLTAAYELDLGKRWGQHRLAGLFEDARLDRERHDRTQILVDSAGVPISNIAAPENNANQLWRRRYVTEGDYRTYYMSDPSIAPPPITVAGRTYSVREVGFSEVGNSIDRRDTRSLMGAMQNFWLNRRLITTYGYRVDDITFRESLSGRLPATDPRVTSGQKILNEWDVLPGATRSESRDYRTQTLGAVYHATKRISVFYNQSTNVGTPRFDRTVIPGVLPPPSKGKGKDAGIMVDLRGDERYFARLNFFDTTQIGDASIAPGGAGIENNYYTDGINVMLDYLLSRRLLTQAEYDEQFVAFSSMTLDVKSRGAELEFVGNPTRNWTFRLSASFTRQRRENFFSEREPHLSQSLAFVRARDDRGTMTNGLTIEQNIAALHDRIAQAEDNNEGASAAARDWKANATSRYKFSETSIRFLKDVFLGGAVIFQDKPFMQTTPAGVDLYGKRILQTNLFLGKAWKLPNSRAILRLQLNANNVGNNNVIEPGRYTADFQQIRRVYLREPRNYRFTASVEF